MKISKTFILNISLLLAISDCLVINRDLAKSSISSKAKPSLPLNGESKYEYNLILDNDIDTVISGDEETLTSSIPEKKKEEKNESNYEDEEVQEIEVPTQCSQGSYEISSESQLAELYQCDDIIGSVHIQNYHGSTLDTGDIKTISGDFVISNASNLVRINTPKLAVIGGKFKLNELTSLTSVNSPFLNNVGIVEWKVLPILSTVNFDYGIKKVKSITISDTSLIAFNGFDSEILDTLNINNNRFLESISTGLKGINEKLSISANARNIVVSFPKLEYANNITIRDVSSLDFSNIHAVNKSLELINNNFQSVKFPKLKSVGGTLSLIENWNLKDVEFNQIEDISGGLMLINNTYLNKLNFFPKLTSIGGAIKFVGDFRDASFSKLKVIKGSALIDTASNGFDCSKWTRNDSDNGIASIIRGGSIVCRSSGREQTVKYNNEGEIVDEIISIIDDTEDVNRGKSGYSNSAVTFLRNDNMILVVIALAFLLVA